MDKYLNRLCNEHKKTVRFQIVEDNARLHSSMEVDRWASTDSRIPLRRHHSQPIPILRKRCDNGNKATTRWSSETSTSTAPLKCPKRMLSSGGDRWRVGRNNSDSMIHSPPKRRYTSPNSPMLMIASLKVAKGLPSSLPLQTNEVILDHALQELSTDVEQPRDDSTNTETESCSWNLEENNESVPLVQTRQVPPPQQSQHHDEESYPAILKSLFALVDLVLLWSIWNSISIFISDIISRCNKDDKKPGPMSNDERILENMDQGEAIPLATKLQRDSPAKSW